MHTELGRFEVEVQRCTLSSDIGNSGRGSGGGGGGVDAGGGGAGRAGG